MRNFRVDLNDRSQPTIVRASSYVMDENWVQFADERGELSFAFATHRVEQVIPGEREDSQEGSHEIP